jgi:hypothetical protein
VRGKKKKKIVYHNRSERIKISYFYLRDGRTRRRPPRQHGRPTVLTGDDVSLLNDDLDDVRDASRWTGRRRDVDECLTSVDRREGT